MNIKLNQWEKNIEEPSQKLGFEMINKVDKISSAID